ncbi:hypothetical protein C8Q77DRAFT_1155588 [Trametes polyzona]|nr:hypothetical protein C8Q77DRAFT_1155588 [Trametes polyzona]
MADAPNRPLATSLDAPASTSLASASASRTPGAISPASDSHNTDQSPPPAITHAKDEAGLANFAAFLDHVYRRAIAQGILQQAVELICSHVGHDLDLMKVAALRLQIACAAPSADKEFPPVQEPQLQCTRCRAWYLESENSSDRCRIPHFAPPQPILIRGAKAAYPAYVHPCCGSAFVALPGLATPSPYCYMGPHTPMTSPRASCDSPPT